MEGVPQPQELGTYDHQSLLTTYPKWDDPPYVCLNNFMFKIRRLYFSVFFRVYWLRRRHRLAFVLCFSYLWCLSCCFAMFEVSLLHPVLQNAMQSSLQSWVSAAIMCLKLFTVLDTFRTKHALGLGIALHEAQQCLVVRWDSLLRNAV